MIAALILFTGHSAVWQPAATAQTQDTPPIQVEKVEVTPKNAGAETLCQLWVTIRNNGSHYASAFEFEVQVASHQLPVYGNHSFLTAVAPGESKRLRLFNFWTNETGRPYPGSGSLEVSVSLQQASWWTLSEQNEQTTWTFVSDIEQASQVATVTVQRPS